MRISNPQLTWRCVRSPVREEGADGFCLYRALQVHRARQGAGLERLVQRAEDRADAAEAAFSHLPALHAHVGDGPKLSRALGAASPDAFKTEQYTTDWGFFEWAPYITDWSRDLFDGGDAPEASFAVPAQGALDVVSFDGMTSDEAHDARPALAKSHPDMMWLPVIGLDRHTPTIGLRVLRERVEAGPVPRGQGRVQEAVYRPISDFITAE